MKLLKKISNYFRVKNGTSDKEIEYKEKIAMRLQEIDSILKDIKEKDREININIEEIKIDNPTIDNIIFELDKIDVKELKGKLNIGFIFGAEKSTPENLKKIKGKIREKKEGASIKKTKGNNTKKHAVRSNQSSRHGSINEDKIKTNYINNMSTYKK